MYAIDYGYLKYVVCLDLSRGMCFLIPRFPPPHPLKKDKHES